MTENQKIVKQIKRDLQKKALIKVAKSTRVYKMGKEMQDKLKARRAMKKSELVDPRNGTILAFPQEEST